MFDLTIYETGNGGDLILGNGDFQSTGSFYNMIYLAWFGGNVKAVTREDEIPNQQRFDYWGNKLLHPAQPGVQFNSNLEKALNDNPITSAARLLIEEAAINDLAFMAEFAKVEVSTRILDVDRLEISATILEPDVIEDKTFQFIWNATKQEVIYQHQLGAAPFLFPKRNLVKNANFDGTLVPLNWALDNTLNAAVLVLAGSCKITVGAGSHIFSVYTGQKWNPGKKYLITCECITFGVDPADDWGIGFGSVTSSYLREAGDFLLIDGIGYFSGEITAPATPAEPDNLRLVINSNLAFGTAGDFEIINLTVKNA